MCRDGRSHISKCETAYLAAEILISRPRFELLRTVQVYLLFGSSDLSPRVSYGVLIRLERIGLRDGSFYVAYLPVLRAT